MQPLSDFVIEQTTDSNLFADCAAMMADSDPWKTLDMNFDNCLNAFAGPCKEVYVATNKNSIAGFVILQVGGSFKGYIQTLFVDNNLRGNGLGKHILQFCEKRILSISPNIFICVSSFNEGALKLYKEFGFIQVGLLTNFVRIGFDEWLMRKTIGPIAGYVHPDKKN